jgi:hypothetical protein
MRPLSLTVLLLLLPLGPSTGCVGQIAEPGADPRRPPTGDEVPDQFAEDGTCALGVPTAGLTRLTRREYARSVEDLFGVAPDVSGFPADEDPSGIGFGVAASLSPFVLEQHAHAAAGVAESVVERLDTLLPCDPATSGEDACAGLFIDDFAPRAYRHPLDTGQRERLLTVYAATRDAGGDFADGIRVTVEATLSSPSFLYRVEGDAPGGARLAPLSAHERATRLSFALWGTTPDDALLDAAAHGDLATADGVEAEARRMLDDPRGRAHLRAFVFGWLGLSGATVSKNEAAFDGIDWDATWPEMQAETARFVEDVLFAGPGTLEALFTAPYTIATPRTAAIYGVTLVDESPVRLELDPSERAGLLTQPSLLALSSAEEHTSPVLRGKLVRERLLCQDMPSPPPGVEDAFPEVDPTLPVRERFAQHESDPACAGCHVLMDPLGFAFEQYDAIGRYRTTSHGRPIDASGEISGTEHSDTTFDGVVDLARVFGTSEDVRRCVGTQAYRFVFRQDDPGGCALAEARESFASSGHDLRELFVAIIRSDAFLNRQIDEGEAP